MMTFLLPADLSAEAAHELERACVAGGPDNMPWPTRVQVEPGRLLVRRDVEESGYLAVPWDIEGLGRLVTGTATLMERPTPYDLVVELARGKVNQLRCQSADWRAGGLVVPDKLEEEISQATRAFGLSALGSDHRESGTLGQSALVSACQAAQHLVQTYTEQVFQVRHQREPALKTALGCRVSVPPSGTESEALAALSNSVTVPFSWTSIEASEGAYDWRQLDAILAWAEAQQLEVNAGPLIDFSSAQLPDWLWLWERDLSGLARFMTAYVITAVKRYRKRIKRWQLTAAANSASLLSLGEEELMWLTVRLAQAVRQVDGGLEISVGIAQPWGEYMALDDRSHSPFIFADTLVRSELNLAALDLELVMGVTPRGSYCRDLLETSRLLDLYALLGVPLRVTLGYPSASLTDSLADPELRVGAGHWAGGFQPALQAEWTQAFARLALCKPYVQAVHWVHFSDAATHQFPHCGLLDSTGKPKPALQELTQLRQKHIG
jgi:hypothetical protein